MLAPEWVWRKRRRDLWAQLRGPALVRAAAVAGA